MSLRHVSLAIIGAGPAGLAAAIHAARAGIDHVLFDPDPPGGLLRAARLIENVPGMLEGIPGRTMAAQMVAHAQALEVIHYPCRITLLNRTDGGFTVRGSPQGRRPGRSGSPASWRRLPGDCATATRGRSPRG